MIDLISFVGMATTVKLLPTGS